MTETQPQWLQQKLQILEEINALLPRLAIMEPIPFELIDSLEADKGSLWTANEEEFHAEGWVSWWVEIKAGLRIE